MHIDKELNKGCSYHVAGKLNCAELINTRCVSHCLWAVVGFLELHADRLQHFNHLRSLGMEEKPPGIMALDNTSLTAHNYKKKHD